MDPQGELPKPDIESPDSGKPPKGGAVISEKARRLANLLKKPSAQQHPYETVQMLASEGSANKSRDVVTEANQKLKTLERFWPVIVDKATNPVVIGGVVSAAVGILSSFVNIPLGPEISMGMGVASLGAGQGETLPQKVRNAAIGAVGGLGLSQGLHHVPSSGIVEAGSSFLDDAAIAMANVAKEVGSGVLKNRESFYKGATRVPGRISRMMPRQKVPEA